MKNFTLSFKVGLFVLASLLVLGYMTIKITKHKRLIFMKGYEVLAIFDDVSGLKLNNAVVMAGVDIGTVKRISLENGKAKVVMLIKPNVKISKDAKAKVRGTGVVGTKYIEIIQGESDKYIKPGGKILDTSPVTNIDQVLEKINKVTEQINDYLSTEKETLKKITKNIEKATAHMAEISKKIRKGKGTVGKLVNDDALYSDIKDITQRFNEIIAKIEKGQGTFGKLINDETLYQEAKETVSDLKTLVADIKEGKGTLGKLYKDENMYEQAKEAIERLNRIVKKVEAGEGTLGKLVNDESLYEEVKETLRNVRETSTVVREQTPISVLGTAIGVAK